VHSDTSESETLGLARQRSLSVTEGESQQFLQRPILEYRISSIQYYSAQEQFLEFEQKLACLPSQEAFFGCALSGLPQKLRTLDVTDPYVRPAWIELFRAEAMAQHAFWLTYEEARAQLAPKPSSSAVRVLKSYGRKSPAGPAMALDEENAR
jgi:hypothetical protein